MDVAPFTTLEQYLWSAEIQYKLLALSPPVYFGGAAANHLWGSTDAWLYLEARAYERGLSVQEAVGYLFQHATYTGKPPPGAVPIRAPRLLGSCHRSKRTSPASHPSGLSGLLSRFTDSLVLKQRSA